MQRSCAYEACELGPLPSTARADIKYHPACRRAAYRARRDGVPHLKAGERFWDGLRACRAIPRRITGPMRDRARPALAK